MNNTGSIIKTPVKHVTIYPKCVRIIQNERSTFVK